MRKLGLLFILVLILAISCTKNPSGPTAPPSSLVYMPFYSNKVFVIDSSQDKIVDSIEFSFPIGEINLSSNGKVLYVQKGYNYPCYPNCPDSIIEVDVKTKAIRYEGENSSLFPTPDGKYLVSIVRYSRLKGSNKWFKLFSALTHQVVYESNLELTTRPTFDSQQSLLYMVTQDNKILVFDYKRLQIVRFLDALDKKGFQNAFDILYSELDNRLYFSALDTNFFSYLGSIDTKLDKIVVTEQVGVNAPYYPYWGEGFLFASPSTKKIYLLSWCLCGSIPEEVPYNLFTFSQDTKKIISELGIINADISPFALKILPGGKRAYIGHSFGSIWTSIIDLEQNKIVGYISR